MIGVYGISYRSAGAEIREKYSFQKEEIPVFLSRLRGRYRNGRFVVLSTCNRTEIYFLIPERDGVCWEEKIVQEWEHFKKIDREIHNPVYLKQETEAVKHLFSVASGLDSRIIGELQIIDQVKDAYGVSVKAKSAGPVLNRLFHKSFEASKTIRTRTRLNNGDTGIGDIISKLIRQKSDPVVLVIGTGQIANHVLGRIHRRSCGKLLIAGRTPENVDRTAHKYDADALPLKDLESILPECNVVISAVSVKEPLITKEMLSSELFIKRDHPGDPRLFIDLGMPANLERDIELNHEIEVVHYEALEEQIRATLDQRSQEVRKAKQFIDTISEEFFSWLRSKEIDPALQSVRQKLESINRTGIEAFRSKKADTETTHEVEEYTSLFTSEIMSLISSNIRSLTRNGADIEASDYLTRLFDTKSS
jgi:glutamyl-tRNA reductase